MLFVLGGGQFLLDIEMIETVRAQFAIVEFLDVEFQGLPTVV